MKPIAIKLYRFIVLSSLFRISKRWIPLILKIGITIAIGGYLYQRLSAESWAEWEALSEITATGAGLILLAFLLIPFNWGIEAIKWRTMLAGYYPDLTLFNSLIAVFSGIATGIFTPNRIGEYAGRVMHLKAGHRLEATLYLFVDRLSQMVVTFGSGLCALEYFFAFEQASLLDLVPLPLETILAVRYLAWAIMTLAMSMMLWPRWFHQQLFQRFSESKHIGKAVKALGRLDRKMLVSVMGLCCLRYMVFSLQYLLLMVAFGYVGDYSLAIMLILSVFLIKSSLPSIAITELGVRESVAIAVMGVFAVSPWIAFSSTFVLYIFNIIFPTLIGLIFVYQMKWE